MEHPGFAPYRHTGVVLSLGQTVHLDIVLAPASASAEVTVSAQPSAIDTSQTSVVSSVDQETDRGTARAEPQLLWTSFSSRPACRVRRQHRP